MLNLISDELNKLIINPLAGYMYSALKWLILQRKILTYKSKKHY